jgi:predicted nucleic-acid-binding Zn-ribbon protein
MSQGMDDSSPNLEINAGIERNKRASVKCKRCGVIGHYQKTCRAPGDASLACKSHNICDVPF